MTDTMKNQAIEWERVEPGHYRAEVGPAPWRLQIVRVPTTFGIRRASNDMWEFRIDGARYGARRKHLARAKADAQQWADYNRKGDMLA